jgi:hypothetical protein
VVNYGGGPNGKRIKVINMSLGGSGQKSASKAAIDENGDAGMIGFSTLRRKKGMAYVDLICSDQKGYGSVLLEASEGLARKAGFRVVTLNAIGPAEGFYKKKGYIQSDEPCTRSPKINRSGSQDDGFRYNKCLVGKEVVRMGKHRKAKDHAGLVRPMTKAQLNEEISKKHREAREKKEKKKRKKVDKKADKKQRKLEKQKAEERIERIWKRKVEEREAKEKEKRVRREKRKRERPKRPIRESTQPKPKPPTRRRRPRKKTRRVQEGRSGFVTASGRCRSRYVKRVYVGGKLESVSYFYYIYKEGRKRRVYLPKKKASSNKVFRRK